MNAAGKLINDMKAVRAGGINLIRIHCVNPSTAKIQEEIFADVGSWKTKRRVTGATLWRIIKGAARYCTAQWCTTLLRKVVISKNWIGKTVHRRLGRTFDDWPAIV